MATVNLMNATSMKETLFVSGQLTTTSASTVYTVPSNSGIKLSAAALCNTSSATVSITGLHIVPSGGSASTTNKIVHSYSLAAGDTLSLTNYLGGMMLGDGDSIAVQVGTANAVNVIISGAIAS